MFFVKAYCNTMLEDIEPYRFKRNPDETGKQVLAKLRQELKDTLEEDGIKYDAKFKLVS